MPKKELFAAIENDDLNAVKNWVAEHGIDTKLVYEVPGAPWDATMKGTALNIAIVRGSSRVALWLLENGASHNVFGFSTEGGYASESTLHPLGAAVVQDLDKVVAVMLSQEIDWHALQYSWDEGMSDSGELIPFGRVFMANAAARLMLERIGRLDVLETLAKMDLRTEEEKQYAEECPYGTGEHETV